jgi:hypothetical protein
VVPPLLFLKGVKMRKDIQELYAEMRVIHDKIAELRGQCNHPSEKKIWKEKYGGWFCEDCEHFLPRNEGGTK